MGFRFAKAVRDLTDPGQLQSLHAILTPGF